MAAGERSPQSSALTVEGLSWRIGGAQILREVTLAAHRGEFLGVIGPNGAGKTSLFNLMSGLRLPTAGRIRLNGDDVTALPPHRRARLGLGRSFQSSSVFTTLSVRDNVRLAVAARHRRFDMWRPARTDHQVNDLADGHLGRVGLKHNAGLPAAGLSHGDKRRLEIALLLAGEPSVMLLDEPMAGVATGDIPALLELIAGLTADGRTVLMVEHHIDAILHLADRIAVLHHGALLACAAPAQVMADPTVQQAYLGDKL
ncbi:MAG: ABC transporter ATP-binding protein [Hamadaea sp.]|nr:ABC transporter ATP-binding protein [Hamadaea sp.]